MPKIKHKECKSIKEFNKICRKYIKYFSPGYRNWRYNYLKYWYTWIWVDVLNPWDKELIKYANKVNGNLPLIVKEVQDNYLWSYQDKDGVVFRLIGIEISNEDYYYIYVSKEGKKKYLSCVGKFDDIK